MKDKKFAYFQQKILEHLERLEAKELRSIKKSLREAETLVKAGLPIGTIRTWKGKKFIKIAPNKWKPKYDGESRGAKLAIAALKKKAANCTDSKQLMQLVLENRSRFSDESGRPLPFVQELSDYVSELNDKIESDKRGKGMGQQIDKIYARQLKRVKALRKKGYTDEQIDNDRIIKQTKQAMRDLDKPENQSKRKVRIMFNKKKLGAKPVKKNDGGDDGGNKRSGTVTQDLELLSGVLESGKSATIRHNEIGEIIVDAGTTGKSGYGIKHIIEQRYAKDGKNEDEITALMPLVLDAAKSGTVIKDVTRMVNGHEVGTVSLEKNGIIAFISKKRGFADEKFIITGFDNAEKKQEATDAIKAVIASHSYAPDFVNVKKQVGAVIASLKQSIPENADAGNKNLDNGNKDENEAPSAKSSGIEKIKAQYEATRSVSGDADEIYVGDKTFQGTWKLVEAVAPSASHNERTFYKTEGFPENADGSTVNDRDYEHDKAAQEAVISVAGKYDGRALSFDSPVVVTQDGVVVSGNNRTMSSKLAASKGTDGAYIEALKKRAKKFGFDAKDLEGFKNPRVVFEIQSDDTYSTQQFAQFNESETKAMNPIETAVKVSKTVKPETVKAAAEVITEFDTMGELYADSKAVGRIFDKFETAGIINRFTRPQYENAGAITGAGKEFLETVLIGSVVNEKNIRGLNREGCKSIRRKLVRAISPLVNNKSMGGYAVTDQLNEAIDVMMQVNIEKDKFKSVSEFAMQQNMFEKQNPVAIELAKKLEGKEKDFADFMQGMNAALEPGASGQVDIFFGGVETKEDVLNRMLGIKKAVAKILTDFLARKMRAA